MQQFSGPDGSQPFTGLVRRSSDGSLFSGTFIGGSANLGVVFQLTQPKKSGGSWTEQTIYTFMGTTDGGNAASVVVNAEGSVFGMTSGTDGSTGTLFHLSKPAEDGSQWVFKSLYSDPLKPIGPLRVGSGDRICGTDCYGGSSGQGSVYLAVP